MLESVIQLFTEEPPWLRPTVLIGSIGLALLLESVLPLVRVEYGRWRHYGKNLVLLAAIGVVSTLMVLLALVVLELDQWRYGLLNVIEVPLWVELAISLLALDFFAQYSAHALSHRFKWMWKLHMVHHSDPYVDASTGTRLHPGDFLVREVFALTAVMLIGIPYVFYAMYRLITLPFSYMTHANVSLPRWLDRALSWVVVSPNMHKVHHHFERPWTNCNYGNIFSIWDRLFGSFAYVEPERLRYGLDVLDDRGELGVGQLFQLPFDKSVKTDY